MTKRRHKRHVEEVPSAPSPHAALPIVWHGGIVVDGVTYPVAFNLAGRPVTA